jgi:glycosyltransferase involved in cell wall biosynthesis
VRVHQLIPCFTPADAMGQAAVAWQRVLRHLGATGEVYADEVAPAWRSLVRPATELRPEPDDLVLYHHGIASPLAGRLLHLPCRKGLVFHNVTPAHFYAGTQLEEPLVAGRAQVAALAGAVDVALGVSAWNVRELVEAGHRDARVVPLFVEPERFTAQAVDAALLARLTSGGRPRVVSVSRVVPHKRMEDLLSLHAELRTLAPRAELLVVGAYAPGNPAFRRLATRAKALGGVTFLGRVDHAGLVAAYRAGDVFVSMSEHEGFGVPLVEAMAADVPVLAYGAAAVPETMGGRGLVFDEKHFAALAEVVQLLVNDAELRQRVVAGQRERVAELSFEATRRALGEALAPFLPARATLGGPRGVAPASGAPARRSTLPGPRAGKPRVAFVVQRYGDAITGGAEAHARQVAERLAKQAHVDVLTTCAVDHLTWANALPAGVEPDGPVTVHRFPVTRTREMRAFNRLSRAVFGRAQDYVTEAHWLAEQGPRSPALLDAIAARRDDFDAFVFFTCLYAPTAWGVPLVGEKALVVPTAHDEAPMAFHALADGFTAPRALLCNTPEEAAFIERRYPGAAPRRVVGVGIEPLRPKPERFREAFGVRGPYLLYVGRLEAGKGVVDLVARHQALVREFHDAPTLVLAGAGDVKPSGTRVVCVGRIDEQAKWDALSGALAVVVPSRYESLSLLTLEAFASGTPVLGNAASEVVAGQLARSGGGVTFDLASDAGFREAVREVGAHRERFGRAGRAFAAKATWPAVMAAYLEEIDRIRRTT